MRERKVPFFFVKKMITTEYINNLISEKLAEKDCFLVELEIKEGNDISLEIDSMNGVSIQDCVEVSKSIEGNLDRDEEDFQLNVSSAGLDKPLRVKEQYYKNIGREVKVLKLEGEKVKGELKEVTDNEIIVEYSFKEKVEGKKKKQTIVKQEHIPFENIKETTIIISFK